MLFDTKARPPVHAAASRAFPEPLRRGTGHDIFRPPAFASRPSCSRRGVGPSSRSATGPTAGPRRGYRVPHARAATGEGAPYTPRTVVLAQPGRLPDRHPPLPSGQSLNPATTSHHARLSFTGHQQGFNHVHPSGLPLARAPGVEPAALQLSPELRTPPSPAAHVRGGDRPSSTDLELPLNSHPSISNPVAHSIRATSRRTATRRAVGRP